MKFVCRKILCAVCVAIAAYSMYAQSDTATAVAAFTQACVAYRAKDWNSAEVLFKKAVSYPSNQSEETYFMLVSAEMHAEDFKAAIADCEIALRKFPSGKYTPELNYQKGRALFHTGEYNKAVMALSDFCHQNPDHELYAAAIFWLAESFYAGYSYDEAAALYSRVINEFPKSEKVTIASFRLEAIEQRNREDKLLYLLQQTGEEYLAVREEYERQMRMNNMNLPDNLRQRVWEVEAQVRQMQMTLDRLALENKSLQISPYAAEIEQLKLKAKELNDLFEERLGGM